jgi:hypothetical protein
VQRTFVLAKQKQIEVLMKNSFPLFSSRSFFLAKKSLIVIQQHNIFFLYFNDLKKVLTFKQGFNAHLISCEHYFNIIYFH